jgi:hypothetical protein
MSRHWDWNDTPKGALQWNAGDGVKHHVAKPFITLGLIIEYSEIMSFGIELFLCSLALKEQP